MTPSVSFGDWVRRRRRALDMTQDELAQRVSCSVSAIRKIEQDERRPSPEVAELLAAQLHVPASERTLFVQVARGERNVERLSTASLKPIVPAMAAPAVPLRVALPTSAPQAVHATQLLRQPVGLPASITPFIGREAEIEQLAQLLRDPDCRFVTIFGPGGSGKTRLSIEAAQRVRGDFPDGVVFVQLAPLTAPALVPEAVASAVGLERKERDACDSQVTTYLRDRQLLLVLDNFEHLMDATRWVNTLLQETAVKVLVSSRERLNAPGEWVYAIQGLPQPPTEGAGDLVAYSAAALLLAGFHRVQPGYVLQPADRQAIVRICRRLEGMPLALELAAPWIRTLTLAEIAEEIERSYDFLATTARSVTTRHRSLRAAFEHSWQLLGGHEQRVLSRLSVFRGGFGREAAAIVAGASLSDLAALMDKSLLRRAGTARYDVHELVRQFAATCLGEDDVPAHRAHLRFYCDLAGQASIELTGAQQRTWYARLEEEQDNLRAAMDWALAQHETTLALQLGARLWRFWLKHGRVAEGRQRLNAALAQITPAVELSVQIAALHGAGALARAAGDFAAARCYHEQALALRRTVGDEQGAAGSLNNLAVVDIFEGNYANAEELLRSSLAVYQELGMARSVAMTLLNLGIVQSYTGRYVEAVGTLEAAIGMYQATGDRHAVAGALGNLGDALRYLGDRDRAQAVLAESLAILAEMDDPVGMAISHNSLGRLAIDRGDLAQAEKQFHTALGQAGQFGDPSAQVESLEGLANVAAAAAAWTEAVTLAAAAAVRRRRLNTQPPPVEGQVLAATIRTARTALGEVDFAAAWTQGEQLAEEALLGRVQSTRELGPGDATR